MTSKNRGSRLICVVLPAPLRPTIAIICPARTENDTLRRIRAVPSS